MRTIKYVCLAMVILMLAGSVAPVRAQSYSFQVPSEFVLVTINADGTITLDYTITFKNDSGALAIDAVDIGIPTTDYSIRSISAAIDGKSITRIEDSPYVNGVALYLQGNEIPAGGSGTVTIHIPSVGNVLYEGTENESEPYASLQFSPNWFDSSLCYGSTQLQVTFLFPAGITDQEPRYYTPSSYWPGSETPEMGFTADTNTLFYTWVSESANAYTQYTFGASFPMRLVDSNAIVTGGYVAPENTSTDSGGGISFGSGNVCGVVFCLGLIGFFGVIFYSATVGAKKRKLQYLPPKISIEGHGIKRGLTAVEAGILMEQPMDKILTMTLFALLKKEAAEVTVKEPLTIKAASPLPSDLYGYETDFLTAFQEVNTEKRKKLLQVMMVNLIRGVGEKMKGFSKKETIIFYEDIMRRAWEQVEAAATPEVKGQVYQEVIDWTMLDKNYDDRTRQTFSSPVFIPTPTWWWRYDPTFARTSTIGTSTAGSSSMPSLGGGGRTVSLPSLPGSAFAASVVNGVQNFSSNVLGNVASFTSGITNVTNPVPPPSTYRSSGGGGGHSCACACACAGCACACAGGGR